MNLTKIGNLEAIALLLIVSTNHLLLNMPQTIIDTCGSASLLNIIYSTILVFIIAYILLFLLFKYGQGVALCKKFEYLLRFDRFDFYFLKVGNLPRLSFNRFGDEINVISVVSFCKFAYARYIASTKCRKLEICDNYAVFKQNIVWTILDLRIF